MHASRLNLSRSILRNVSLLSMLNVMITGASGFVGQQLVKALKKQDIYVVGVGRKLVKSEADIFYAIPDFDANKAWREPLKDCVAVVHLAARVHVMHEKAINPLEEFRKVNVECTLRLAQEAANAGVKRFIFISSIGVNGNTTAIGRPFSANDKPQPNNPYAISKFEAEQGLIKLSANTGMELVIIRPPLVYGFGAPGNFKQLLNALKKKIPLPLRAINNKRSFVYVGNLVSLITRCIEHPNAANQVFLVSDGHDLSTTELLRACAKALGVKAKLFSVPQKLIQVTATMLGKRDVAQRLCGNLQVDISKARNLLDWEPPISVVDGLKATVLGLVNGK